jgi:hypothetical protein
MLTIETRRCYRTSETLLQLLGCSFLDMNGEVDIISGAAAQ